MFCITYKDSRTGRISYLAWQNPGWNDYGYFWTSKEVFRSCLPNNTLEHPFLFRTKGEAVKLLNSIGIPQKCSIVKWD